VTQGVDPVFKLQYPPPKKNCYFVWFLLGQGYKDKQKPHQLFQQQDLKELVEQVSEN
jgi:hypothetical protein